MLKLLETKLYANSLTAWGLTAAIAVVLLAVSLFVKSKLLAHLPETGRTDARHWRPVLRDLVQRTSPIFLAIASIYAGAAFLYLPFSVRHALYAVFVVALFIQCALWADRIVAAAITWQFAPRRTKAAIRNALSLIQFLVRVAVWSIALLLIFENLGFDVTALVAGLGIGGIAIALAAQNVLGDLLSSLAIVLDRPFEVGDFIVFGDQSGTVEQVGIKTTRLRSVSGEQIVCANSDLLGSRIHNYKRMTERRVVFSVGVVYETPLDKLERIPGLLQDIVQHQELARFERAHFASYGEAALRFEVVYWVLSPDHTAYMDLQQRINFAVLRKFQEEGVELAQQARAMFVPVSPPMAQERPRLRVSGK
jgi:small-conductance mechanosensitive channel